MDFLRLTVLRKLHPPLPEAMKFSTPQKKKKKEKQQKRQLGYMLQLGFQSQACYSTKNSELSITQIFASMD